MQRISLLTAAKAQRVGRVPAKHGAIIRETLGAECNFETRSVSRKKAPDGLPLSLPPYHASSSSPELEERNVTGDGARATDRARPDDLERGLSRVSATGSCRVEPQSLELIHEGKTTW